MARKYEIITELYQRTMKSLTAPQEWQHFLTTACRNFRLPFDEQVLLYAQRPDATAVLPIEGRNGWNERFGRWVNRGATGIAVFDSESTGHSRLKYYFDISDTHSSRFSRRVPIWEMRMEDEAEVVEMLGNYFGELDENSDLASALLSAAQNAVEDNMPDYLSELRLCREDSYLEELDDLNMEVIYRTSLTNSVGYMLLVRCGIAPQDFFTDDDFRGVTEFSTTQTLNALGVATGDIGQMCLSEISRTVTRHQRQHPNPNRTFANGDKSQYPVRETRNTTPERSEEYESDTVHDAGRLQSPEPPASTGTGGTPWEIRIAPPQLSEEEPARDVHESADERQAEPAFDGDRTGSSHADGADDLADGEIRGSDGRTESNGSASVDRIDEQHPSVSGGDGLKRTGLQLETEELNVEPQEAESAQLPAFLDDTLIMAVIANKNDDLKYKKQQIEMFFSIHTDEEERAEYLKSAYQDRFTET